MWFRLANWFLGIPALVLLSGLLAFALGSDSWSWAEATGGGWWYTRQQFSQMPLLYGLAVLAGLLGLGALVLATLGIRRFRRATFAEQQRTAQLERARRVKKVGALSQEREKEQRLNRLRQQLERQICRPKAQAEKVVDAILGAAVDHSAQEVQLVAGSMVAEVIFVWDQAATPMTSISPPLFQKVVQLLRSMAGVPGEGIGEIDFHSTQRVDRLLISLEKGDHGPQVTIGIADVDRSAPGAEESKKPRLSLAQVVEEMNQSPGQPAQVARRLRSSPSMVLRLERNTLPDLRTGEVAVPMTGEFDASEPGSGLLQGVDPTSEREIAPLVTPGRSRPQEGPEVVVRLALAATLTLFFLLHFASAYGWAGQRLVSGQPTAPWREVELTIHSQPSPAVVTFQGRPAGQTPLRLTAPCKGRQVQVVVRAKGHRAWQWSGICPESGQLRLSAPLQPF